MATDRIKLVEGIPQITSELRKALDEHQRNIAYMVEFETMQAAVTRAKFLALVDQGFTEDQAIKLCKP